MILKEFQQWHRLKESINNTSNRPLGYKPREIWWIHAGSNIGFEEDGKGDLYMRPVLILKVFNRQLFWGIPLSSRHRKGLYYFTFQYKKHKSTAIISQLRAYDSKRLTRKFGEISRSDFVKIRNKVRALV